MRRLHSLLLTSAIWLPIAAASASAQTNFGSVNLGSSATQTVTITVSAAATFNAIKVVTVGQTGLDFNPANTGTCTVGVAYSTGQSCTVGVIFKPLQAGLRMGAIVLSNSATGVYDTSYVQGIGAGPQFAFNPGIATATDPTLNGTGLYDPGAVAVDGTGTAFIADQSLIQGGVLKVPSGSTAATVITPHGSAGDYVSFATSVAVDGAGNRIIAGNDRDSHPLAVRIPPGATVGQQYTDPSSTGTGAFNGVAVDGAGDLFLADETNGDIVEYPATPSNAPPIYFTPQPDGIALHNPVGVAVDLAGNLYIADQNNDRVVEIPAGGGAAVAIDPTVNGTTFSYLTGLAVDSVGNLYVCDPYNSRIVEVPVGGGPSIAIQPVVNGLGIHPYGVAFDPDGNLYIADLQEVNYQQTGRIVEIQRSKAALSYAITHVGATSTDSPQTVQVQNVGTSLLSLANPAFPEDFSEDSTATDPCTSATSLTTGQTCNLTIDFHPLTAGNLAESVNISDPAYSYASAKVSVSGTGTNVLLSAYTLSYGSQIIDTESASQQVTLTNGGTSPLAIHGIRVTGANASSFVFGYNCPGSLPAGQSCIIHGHFAPTTAGPMTAAVTITDSEADSPQTIALTGTGITPPVVSFSAPSISFGSTQAGTYTGSQQVTLTNTGGANLQIFGLSITGPNASSFVFGYDCTSIIAPGNSCTIHGHFAPTVAGALTAAITLTDNAAGSPQQVALSGTGTSTPITTVSVSPGTLNFGSQVVGRAGGSLFATLTNTGSGTLTIEGLQLVGPNHESFGFYLYCPPTLAPGASCSVYGHLSPASLGPQMASLVFNINIAGPQPTVALTGTGVAPAQVTLSPTQINFGSEAVGSSTASQDITLTNTGGATLHIFAFGVEGANPSSFGFGNTCGDVVAINASCTIHGHFAPTTTGPLTATIYIEDDASPAAENIQQTITVTGTGTAP